MNKGPFVILLLMIAMALTACSTVKAESVDELSMHGLPPETWSTFKVRGSNVK